MKNKGVIFAIAIPAVIIIIAPIIVAAVLFFTYIKTVPLNIGDSYTCIDGMEMTITDVQVIQRDNYDGVYTFTAFKVRYENKGSGKAGTLADFSIEDETGKTNNFGESSFSRWGFDEKGIPTGEYSPGSVVEGWQLFKGDARNITLSYGHMIDLCTWKIK